MRQTEYQLLCWVNWMTFGENRNYVRAIKAFQIVYEVRVINFKTKIALL